jgi:hypothetical protein
VGVTVCVTVMPSIDEQSELAKIGLKADTALAHCTLQPVAELEEVRVVVV